MHHCLLQTAAAVTVAATGARIHIGQVLQHAQQQGCRTNSGKDYCIIWPAGKPTDESLEQLKLKLWMLATPRNHGRYSPSNVSDSSTNSSNSGTAAGSNSNSSSSSSIHYPKSQAESRQFQSSYEYVTQMTALIKDKIRLELQRKQQRHGAVQRGVPQRSLHDAWRKRSMEAQQQVG
jgi:hypothetical protein